MRSPDGRDIPSKERRAAPRAQDDASGPAGDVAEERKVIDDDRATGGEHARIDTTRSRHSVRASDLLGPGGVVQIEHDGQLYILRLTRNNRLILTK